MKILVAIESKDHKKLADQSLRWLARSGLELRVFVPKGKAKKFKWTIDEVNYHYYVALDWADTVVERTDPMTYAQQHDFDLLLKVPSKLMSWRKRDYLKDWEILVFRGAVGKARVEFGKHPKKRIKHFFNGATMERVEK